MISWLLARIFFEKPGLLPSSDDGGDGSCAAIIPPNKTGVVDGVCSKRQTQLNEIASVASSKTLLSKPTVAKCVFLLVQTVRSFSAYARKSHSVSVAASDAAPPRRVAVYRRQGKARAEDTAMNRT